MPFPVIVPILSIVDSGNAIAVTDGTVYTAPSRANLGIMMALLNIKTSGVDYFAADAYNPLTASSFNFTPILKDGNYTVLYWPVNKKTGLETPVLNDFVYDSVGLVFQRWNGTAWVTATVQDFYTYALASATRIDNKHQIDFQKALDYLNRAFVNGNATFSRDQLQELIIELTIVMKGMTTAFAAAPSNYQSIIEGYYPTVNMINGAIAP